MGKKIHRELAKRLAIKAIERYKNKFMLEVDLLSGEERRKIIEQIDSIIQEIKEDNKRSLTAERDYYKKQVKELEARLNSACSLDNCTEELELWGGSK